MSALLEKLDVLNRAAHEWLKEPANRRLQLEYEIAHLELQILANELERERMPDAGSLMLLEIERMAARQ